MWNLAYGNLSWPGLDSKYKNKYTDLFAFSKDDISFWNIAGKLKFL